MSTPQETPLKAGFSVSQSVAFCVLFFGSGLVSLIYETVWIRAASLEFGSTTLGISTVVAVFMLGLAAGAYVLGKRALRVENPLKLYAMLEAGLGLYALITPFLFAQVLPAFSAFASFGEAGTIWLTVVRVVLSTVVLGVPTFIMGATLPLLARHFSDHFGDGGRWAGLLYGLNTLGACTGTLAAALWLMPTLGMKATIFGAAGFNLVLAISAFMLAPRRSSPVREPAPEAPARTTRHLLIAAALAGFAGMVCEVAWTRVIVLVVGGSIYSYAVVLAVFLAGLGGGSLLAANWIRGDALRARTWFFRLACISAMLLIVSMSLFRMFPGWFVSLQSSVTGAGASPLHGPAFLISAAAMLPAALCMGCLLPLLFRADVESGTVTSRASGFLYSANTIGSVAGAFLAGFLLIPLLSLQGTFYLGAGLLIASAFLVTRMPRPKEAVLAALPIIAILVLQPSWDRALMTSAPFQHVFYYADQGKIVPADVIFYRDGRSATVTVTRYDYDGLEQLGIHTDGKTDGSNWGDLPSQRLLTHLPMLLHPSPRKVCVVGLATGCSAGSAGLYREAEIDVVEIEAAMLEGSRYFRDWNHGVDLRENVSIHITDGRLFLRLHPDTYDLVISQPSNPWLAGPAALFSRETFQLARAALKEEGYFCQWIQLYRMTPETLSLIVRTFLEVFPEAYLAELSIGSDLLLIGSRNPIQFDLQRTSKRLQRKTILEDLAHPLIKLDNVYDLAARVRLGPEALRQLAGTGPIHTDDHPRLAYQARNDLYQLDSADPNREWIDQFADGIGPAVAPGKIDGDTREEILRSLAAAYRRISPDSPEALVCESLIDNESK